MRGLAVFEGYAAEFRVTESVLLDQGFRRDPPDFRALVAEGVEGRLLGMLVCYLLPFTFRARPTLYIKELFVAETERARGVGKALMRAASAQALRLGCATIRWQVARWNAPARRFYERLGARADETWVDYGLTESAMRSLADSTDYID
jgi:GNAT superfamily N-acetyltransferase